MGVGERIITATDVLAFRIGPKTRHYELFYKYERLNFMKQRPNEEFIELAIHE